MALNPLEIPAGNPAHLVREKVVGVIAKMDLERSGGAMGFAATDPGTQIANLVPDAVGEKPRIVGHDYAGQRPFA